MMISLLFLTAFIEVVRAINKQKMWDNEQAMFFDDTGGPEGFTQVCAGDHGGAVSMNNPGCLRSEADRTCLLIGPDTYSRDWCLQRFDDDNCECQSMGERLNVGSNSSMILKGGHKSYSFRVGGCTNRKEWKCHK